MEEPSNGKIEETREVKTLEEEEEEEEEESVIKEVEELKFQVEPPLENVLDGNSEASKVIVDGNDLIPENITRIEEKVEDEKKGPQEVFEKETNEPSLESSEVTEFLVKNSDSIEVGKKVIEDKSLLTLDGIGAAEEGKIPSLEVKDGLPEVVTVSLDTAEDVVVCDVFEQKAVQASGYGSDQVGKSVEEIVQQSTNANVVGSSDAIPENAGNTPIVSLRQRAGQPTSWRSCCGLLEVLQRSNR